MVLIVNLTSRRPLGCWLQERNREGKGVGGQRAGSLIAARRLLRVSGSATLDGMRWSGETNASFKVIFAPNLCPAAAAGCLSVSTAARPTTAVPAGGGGGAVALPLLRGHDGRRRSTPLHRSPSARPSVDNRKEERK